MGNIKALAEKESKRIKKDLEECDRMIAAFPAGHLKCCKHGDRMDYYIVKTECGRRTAKYIRKGDHKCAEDLAIRDHCIRKRSILKENLRLLDYVLDSYDQFPDITASKQMNPDHLVLINDRLHSQSPAARKWKDAEYEKGPLHPEGLIYRTMSGVKVRSKSEVIIADQLFGRGIPFRYESLITVNGQDYHPDFTVYDDQTAGVVIWEHFGLMSIGSYRLNAFKKLSSYAACGFELDKNLIATFEWEGAPLDPAFVALLIDHYFC